MCIEGKIESVTDILAILSDAGIVIMPCDTIYGIVGVAPASEKKIRELKGREETKPFLLLIRKDWVSRFTEIEIDRRFMDLWPGPLTLIVPGLDGYSIALRVPDDDRLQNLLSELNEPLYSTSVNRSGQESLYKTEEIEKEFGSEVDLFVNEGDLEGGLPSTIIDISQKPYKLLREGACRIDLTMLS
ncbi:MAG: L-threonylcarbamoyladenylate synthase [Spirochaetales bacterium]|nr:L-threonylcarbamoyladenylate synthase [Spirochaetales bacterium]